MNRFSDTAVVTIPISPPRRDKPGILSLCLTMDLLSKKMNANSYLYLNMMDSYVDRFALRPQFEESLKAVGLTTNNIRLDIDHQSHIARNINTLMQKGYIARERTEILSCSCGRIDCKADLIDDLKGETQFRKETGGAVVCNSCETTCKVEEKDTLVLKMPGTEKLPVTVPEYLGKEMATLRDKFAGQSIVISKERDTGYVFDFDGQLFNIDVDFCTYNYLSSLKETNKVVVGSSHVIYQMYMINLIESLCNPSSNVAFVPIAHIGGTCDLDIHAKDIDAKRKQIYLASAVKLSKETNWPSGKLQYVTRQPEALLYAVYEELIEYCRPRPEEEWDEYLARAISEEINMSDIRNIETKKFKQAKFNGVFGLYAEEVQDFLDVFEIKMQDIYDIWRKEKRFLDPDELIQYLARNSDERIQNFARCITEKDTITNAFMRMDFIVGLADTYAHEIDSSMALVEVDTINSNGAGKVLGSDRMLSIFGKVNDIFISTLKEYGATTAFAIDHAKNDDYRIVVAGLAPDKLKKALAIAQQKIDEFFIFASDLPHSKYDLQWGLGAGYGSRLLGKNMNSQELDSMLFRECEYKKRDSARNRKKMLAEYTERQPVHPRLLYTLVDAALDRENGLFNDRYPMVSAWRDNAQDITNYSDEDKRILWGLQMLHNLRDGSTGALRDCFLLQDARAAANQNNPVTLINLKMENSAGVNKLLTRAHSVVMTRDYARILQEVAPSGARVYYIGRNSFNVLFQREIAYSDIAEFETNLKQSVDREINDKTIQDYFGGFNLALPNHLEDPLKKMGEIPNLRGNAPGITTINFASTSLSTDVSQRDLFMFQQTAIGGLAHLAWEFNDAAAFREAESVLSGSLQIPQISYLYQAAKMRLNL